MKLLKLINEIHLGGDPPKLAIEKWEIYSNVYLIDCANWVGIFMDADCTKVQFEITKYHEENSLYSKVYNILSHIAMDIIETDYDEVWGADGNIAFIVSIDEFDVQKEIWE